MDQSLSSVIKVGFDLQWDFPVLVNAASTFDKRITGPSGALKYLLQDFPKRSGQSYWAAIGACHSALLYRGNLSHSRNCFIKTYANYMAEACPVG
jgi:hypothetical protein